MMKLLKKTVVISVLLSMVLLIPGCAKKGTALPINQMSAAAATGILQGIANMDDESADQMLDLETDEIEDFFAQYGYSIDGKAFVNGLNGFRSARDEMGSILSIEEPEMTSDEEEISATFLIKGQNRDATAVVVMNKKNKIIAITTNAHFTTQENITKAALNTVLGMGTTFVILIFLSIIISLFQYIPSLQAKFEKSKKGASDPAVDKTINQIIEKEEQNEELEGGELIAVITAAVAAYEASSGTASPSGDGFVVRSIRRRV